MNKSRIHIPHPTARPGEAPDFSYLELSPAGALAALRADGYTGPILWFGPQDMQAAAPPPGTRPISCGCASRCRAPCRRDRGREAEEQERDRRNELPVGVEDRREEDLEPVLQEPTLAAWSSNAAPEEDIVSEPPDQMSAVDEDVFAATETVFGEEPTAAALESVAEEAEVTESLAAESVPAFVEPVAEPASKEEPLPATEQEPEPAAVAATLVDAETKAAALSEDDIEQIIEKVVTEVVEKLAGSILERVAWEVVPDLAEHLIREEIRKIKEAAA